MTWNDLPHGLAVPSSHTARPFEMFFNDWFGVLRVLIGGLIGYTALVLILRVSGKRALAKMNAFDLVVTVALGSSLATVLLSREVAIVEGVLAFGLLAGLQFVVAWASVRSRKVRRIVKSQPALVFYRGRFQHETLARERLTESEVRAAVREQGYGSLGEVDAVVLETAGELSVIARAVGEPQSTLQDVRDRPADASSASR